MKDMNVDHLHFSSQEEAILHVPDVMPSSVEEFSKQAVARIDNMFDYIAEVATNV
jgi:hypothetical protein